MRVGSKCRMDGPSVKIHYRQKRRTAIRNEIQYNEDLKHFVEEHFPVAVVVIWRHIRWQRSSFRGRVREMGAECCHALWGPRGMVVVQDQETMANAELVVADYRGAFYSAYDVSRIGQRLVLCCVASSSSLRVLSQTTTTTTPQSSTMIVELIALLVTLGITLAVTVPLNGALVRLRANFNPKSIQLDAEGNVEPHTGPVVTSFFGMLKRVKRIEVSLLWVLPLACRSIS